MFAKMVRLLAASLCLSAAAQEPWSSVFMGSAASTVVTVPPVYPTNLPNAICISWWQASNYTTNAGVPTLVDSGTNGYTMTNLAAAGTWPTNGGTLNGVTLLRIGTPALASTYLRSANYTSSQPHTVCLVLKLDDADTISKTLFSGFVSGSLNTWVEAGGTVTFPKKIRLNAGAASDQYLFTNTWTLAECCFTNGASRVYTNGVASAAASDAGIQTCNGFTLGAAFNGGTGSYWLLGEAMTFSTVLTAPDRTALYSYVRSKYGAANFP